MGKMRLFLTREFARAARKNFIQNHQLIDAVSRAEQGLIDADLGAHLIKQRVGRRGAYRTIIFHKVGERAVFLHLFEKSRQANLTPFEEQAYRDLAKVLAGLEHAAITKLVDTGKWKEIKNEPNEEGVSKRSAPLPSSGRRGSPRRRSDR
jgi:hypothetical protein